MRARSLNIVHSVAAMPPTDDAIEALRQLEFPITRKHVYLDYATFGPLPASHVRAAREALERTAGEGSLGLNGTGLFEAVREEAATLLQCGPRNVCLLTSTSEAMGLLASGLDWQSGDEMVVLEHEFEGCVAPFLGLREVTLRVAQAADEIPGLVGDRTRAVALSVVDRATGARAPVDAIAAACRKRGAWLALDAAQAMGVLDLDAAGCGADVVAAHGYKFLLSGFGLAPTYCSDRALEKLRVPRPGWKNTGVGRQSAARFEPTMSSIPVLAGMRESLRLLNSFASSERENRAMAAAHAIADGLRTRGFDVPSVTSTLVTIPHSAQLLERLRARGVVAAAVDDRLRLSTHFFTTQEDVARLLRQL
jgi:selenocysteine lyase/cysteine desulfurase